ncbi:HU family DNA-binding protein [Scrofimicrobium sp. R131]|uniref:HU family DNA-binding protein n=1 Tax=Scrofimicrobium appendicitidis TaxID=3079930 RepID=A0AAU7V6F2_9ACTO
MSMNRTEIVAAIADRAGLTKTQADAALGAFQEVLIDSLSKGEAVKVTGLMSVERVERAARTGRNPRTGEEIQIPAGYGVKLTAGSTLKKAVSNK